MTTDAVGPDPATVTAPAAGKPRRREIRTDDGRVFRVGVEVLYHASEGPDYPLLGGAGQEHPEHVTR